ncbi:MAG TPA: NADAR domain-containing protein [Nostocaceae cyanobacterium]|nr:NADAR domain-containing protein [Nostocaceae cyanobacterium]
MTIYFYKVSQPYGCFSNFSPHHIEMQGVVWPTVEHYYQAQKFVGSPDEGSIPLILAAPTPEAAAALGRCHSRQVRLDWDFVKTEIMRTAVLSKFLTHEEIRDILLVTGDELIVEDSPRDYFWGCGADHTGKNQLGKILMSVREEIRQLTSLSVRTN